MSPYDILHSVLTDYSIEFSHRFRDKSAKEISLADLHKFITYFMDKYGLSIGKDEQM